MRTFLDLSEDSVIDDGILLGLPPLHPITLDEYKDLSIQIQTCVSLLDDQSFSVVFGSVAKNSPTPSDLDIIIVSDTLYNLVDFDSTDYLSKMPQDIIASTLGIDMDRYYIDVKVISKTNAQTSEFWANFKDNQLDPEFLGNVLTRYYLVSPSEMTAFDTPLAFANRLGIQENILGL
jgi:predicted nucleotidyltransferase